jgi:hypothetical protein
MWERLRPAARPKEVQQKATREVEARQPPAAHANLNI